MFLVSIVTTLEQCLWGRIPLLWSTRVFRYFLLWNECFYGCLNLQQISQNIMPNGVWSHELWIIFICCQVEFLTSYQLKGRSNMSSNQEGSFQIFPLVTSSVNLAAFFIGKCLALCFLIVYRKSARFREPLKKKKSFVLKRENKASKAIKELRLNWKRALNYKWCLYLIKIVIRWGGALLVQ